MSKAGLPLALLASVLLAGVPTASLAHCEVPCGIFDDDARLATIDEHIETIAKAIRQLETLTGAPPTPLRENQIVRWVMTKESHADDLRHIVVQYFLAQKIAVPESTEGAAWTAYVEQLTAAHRMLRAAMKCKQTVDLQQVEQLRQAAHDFRHAYRAAQN